MVIRGRAPLRVSFGGGGTDVEPFCVEQGGAILGSTINKYAYCSIVPRGDDQIIVHSLDFDMTVKYNTRENYVYDGKLDLVKAALKAMEIRQRGKGFSLRHEGRAAEREFVQLRAAAKLQLGEQEEDEQQDHQSPD